MARGFSASEVLGGAGTPSSGYSLNTSNTIFSFIFHHHHRTESFDRNLYKQALKASIAMYLSSNKVGENTNSYINDKKANSSAT